MTKYKKNVVLFLLTSFIVITSFFSLLFFYDPLKLFHRGWVYPHYLQYNMREQAAGIINNWKFDSVILGSSMTENTSSKEASKLLGGLFVNLSIPGGDNFERAIILKRILETHQIKTVLYSLDYLGSTTKGNDKYKVENWDYLYDNNRLNDFWVYMNEKYLPCLLAPKSKRSCMGHSIGIDRPNAWAWTEDAKGFGGIYHWLTAHTRGKDIRAFKKHLEHIKAIEKGNFLSIDTKILKEDKKRIKEYLDTYILSFVKQNPDIKFLFSVSSFSRLKYALEAQYDKPQFERYKIALRYLVIQSEKYKNMSIYAWGNQDFLENIKEYKDLEHHQYKYNTAFLEKMKEDKDKLTIENIEQYLDLFTQKALDYNVSFFGKAIEKYIK